MPDPTSEDFQALNVNMKDLVEATKDLAAAYRSARDSGGAGGPAGGAPDPKGGNAAGGGSSLGGGTPAAVRDGAKGGKSDGANGFALSNIATLFNGGGAAGAGSIIGGLGKGGLQGAAAAAASAAVRQGAELAEDIQGISDRGRAAAFKGSVGVSRRELSARREYGESQAKIDFVEKHGDFSVFGYGVGYEYGRGWTTAAKAKAGNDANRMLLEQRQEAHDSVEESARDRVTRELSDYAAAGGFDDANEAKGKALADARLRIATRQAAGIQKLQSYLTSIGDSVLNEVAPQLALRAKG